MNDDQAADLARAKAIVTHLLATWPAVLRQRQYMQTMSESQELAAALEHTYAAHVHNAVGSVLVMDLIRAVGALILDRNGNSASVVTAVALVGREHVARALSTEMTEVKPGRYVDESAASALSKALSHHAEGYYRDARADLEWIEREVLSSEIAGTLRIVRNKAVAHHDLVREGTDWKLWRIEGTGLTYGQLDAFIDTCTEAIHRLAHLVLRKSHAFDLEPEHAKQWAEEYVQALVAGLRREPAALGRDRAFAQVDPGFKVDDVLPTRWVPGSR